MRRLFVFVTFPLATVTVVLLVLVAVFAGRYANYEQQLAKSHEAARGAAEVAAQSGRDFRLKDAPVRSELLGLPTDDVHRGDSLVLVYRITSRTRGDESGIANETDGLLTPTLTVGDCTVTAHTPALTKSTDAPLAAFVWQWSVDECKSVGYKAVQLLLAFDGPKNGADPVADRELAFVHFTDPFAWSDVLTVLGVVTGTLTVISALVALFGKRKAEEKAPK